MSNEASRIYSPTPQQIRIGMKAASVDDKEWSPDWAGEHEITGIYLVERGGQQIWKVDQRHGQDGWIYDGNLEDIKYVVPAGGPQ